MNAYTCPSYGFCVSWLFGHYPESGHGCEVFQVEKQVLSWSAVTKPFCLTLKSCHMHNYGTYLSLIHTSKGALYSRPEHIHVQPHHAIPTSQEELADYEERNKRRTSTELAKVIVIRIFTNLFTVLVLLGGGVAIFYAAQLSLTTVSCDMQCAKRFIIIIWTKECAWSHIHHVYTIAKRLANYIVHMYVTHLIVPYFLLVAIVQQCDSFGGPGISSDHHSLQHYLALLILIPCTIWTL